MRLSRRWPVALRRGALVRGAVWRGALLGGALLLAPGCSPATGPVPALRVTAALDRSQAAVGDTVTILVEAVNAGDRPLRVPGGGGVAFLEVRDAEGRVVEFGRRLGPTIMIGYPPRELAPTERLSDRPRWAGELRAPAGAVAPPGVYRVRAAVPVLGVGGRPRYAYSNAVEVRLTAP